MSSTFSRQHRHHGRPPHRGKPRARSDGYRAALTVQMRADLFLDLMVTASKETNPTDPAPITKDTMALVAATFNHSYRDHCVSFAVLGGEEGSQVPNVQPALLHQVQDGHQDHSHLVHGTHRPDPPHPHKRGAQPRAMQHLHRQPLSECRVANSSASWTRSTTSTTPIGLRYATHNYDEPRHALACVAWAGAVSSLCCPWSADPEPFEGVELMPGLSRGCGTG